MQRELFWTVTSFHNYRSRRSQRRSWMQPAESSSGTQSAKAAPGVVVQDVCVVFQRRGGERFEALRALSFQIPRGQVFCLLGPNGSGKTTTINLIVGLLQPTRGTVQVAGLDPINNRKAVLRKIALVPQETALYDELTARENLVFHGNYYGVEQTKLDDRIDELLALVQLTERQHDPVRTFSGGMQRRLSLARALLTSPDVLLLDEPTLGVDVQSRNAIWEQIRRLTQSGTTVLLTTNYMEEADALAQTILIIDRGQPVVMGTPDQLKAKLAYTQLVIKFTNAVAARHANHSLAATHRVELQDDRVSLHFSDTQQALHLLHSLPQVVHDHVHEITGIDLKEPTLQDVFLHFTGRELRD